MTEYTDCCECLWDEISEFPTPVQPSGSGGGSLLALGLIAGVIMLSTGKRR